MKAERAEGTRRWVASAIGALIVVAGFLLLLGIPRNPNVEPVATAAPKPPVDVARPGGKDKVLNEEAMMQDQMPLFLPTEWNVAPRPPRRPEAGGSVLDQDKPRFTFGEAGLELKLPTVEQVPENVANAVMADPAATPLYGFGRANIQIEPLPVRGGFVEILDTRLNRRVFAQALAVEAKPPTEKPWRPLEFLAVVDAAGLVGQLLIKERSDVEEVDNYFRNYLVQTFRIGERLSPGFYRVVVGP